MKSDGGGDGSANQSVSWAETEEEGDRKGKAEEKDEGIWHWL